MSDGFLRAENGNKSSERLNQTIVVWGGVGIALFAIGMAYTNAISNAVVDIGMNIVYLVLGMIGLGIGGKVGTSFANRKKEIKKEKEKG